MTLDTLASLLSPFDALALGVMALGWYLLGWRIEKADAKTPSVTILMADYRREWLVHFVTRQPRIYDASVISSLRQSTNWLASTTLLALGGLLALIEHPGEMAKVQAERRAQREARETKMKDETGAGAAPTKPALPKKAGIKGDKQK